MVCASASRKNVETVKIHLRNVKQSFWGYNILHEDQMTMAFTSLACIGALALDSFPDVGSQAFVSGRWSLSQDGNSGVSGMQLAVVTETTAILFDKVEHNALTVDGHPAWSAELNLVTKTVRPLNPLSNTWCATGSFLGNGTFISSAGNPIIITGQDGLQAIRLFTPCTDGKCDIFEDQNTVRLTSDRWYPSSVRIEDGSVLIFGGSIVGGFINDASVNNPTYEFYPPKNIHGFNGLQIPSKFLVDTLNGNHFPNMIYLPDGNIFIAANQQAMIFNWRTNTETRLPGIPNGVRVSSPFSASAVLLPLTPENGYTPEVMICGGSTAPDNLPAANYSVQTPTSAQCSRLLLTPAGIKAGWQVEFMPQPRIMLDFIQLPDMRFLIVNGAQTGVAGYGFSNDRIGDSDAANPAFTPVIYDPAAPVGKRFFSAGIPATTIPRLYHSTASLTPNGSVMLAGSNPNTDVSTVLFPTEYRLEFYSPPYMSRPHPTYTGLPETFNYNEKIKLQVNLPPGVKSVSVHIMDLGFATHGVHMDQRLVKLVSTLSSDRRTLVVTGPPSPRHYPPGPAFVYVVTNEGVPSFGHKTLIGTGASPPVDLGAIAK
ncbi:copper radical oxidase [Agrocybe pediades]|nr:copper radical oxidase [Agrocybe pediades]